MTYNRKLHNAHLLPNGNVFVSGGSSGMESPDAVPSASPIDHQVLTCEMWKPPSSGSPQGQWSLKASLPRYRGYHSIALLLPDGRVLSAGGDPGMLVPNASAEVYTPEYLFDSSGLIPDNNRPAITVWPANGISYYNSSTNQSFTISTSNLTGNTPRVTMLAAGSVD